ncbi:hypothetical protein D9756_010785 [Leucocoprinus leucothites]|uniref:NACHT domain-containing protein n=1 Tax=Leucocoprinus leucothites TaxID=201217 RepID=A0A8H5CUA2_9AGAR|nr:hypothetical protein D9756_010785 [Leucoagaricus leucothites]
MMAQSNSRSLQNLRNAPLSSGSIFENAHGFKIDNLTMMGQSTDNDKEAIRLLDKESLRGAEFDSSERDPPPRCHPGTRLDISGEIQSWIDDLARTVSILWLDGPAGVGKSAIIQTISERDSESPNSILAATLFFAKARRDDPQRVFVTIAYQLAQKYPSYRAHVVNMLTRDPRIVHKSMREQFKHFILQPIIAKVLFKGHHETILIALDGLDECKGERAQQEIVSLIGQLVIQHPTSPIIWIIASRPEPHIRSAFKKLGEANYRELLVPIDSDQACQDVERYLHDKFQEIRVEYSTSFSTSIKQWPSEVQFTKIANRAYGMFIFASVIIQFICDTAYANPISQLEKVICIIDRISVSESNPFATLDALYTEILSAVSDEHWCIVKDLLHRASATFVPELVNICCVFSVTQAEAYAALHKLHSIIRVPEPEVAKVTTTGPYHASFWDYLHHQSRSGVFHLDPDYAQRRVFKCATRILAESYNPINNLIDKERIHLTWPLGQSYDQHSDILRYMLEAFMRMGADVIEECGFDELSRFFQALCPTLPSQDILYHTVDLVGLAIEPTSLKLLNWGLLSETDIQSFNFHSINVDKEMNVTSFGELDDLWPTLFEGGHSRDGFRRREFDIEFPDPIGRFMRISTTDTYWHDYESLGSECDSSCDIILSKCPDWKAHIQEQLATVTVVNPQCPVYILGNGKERLALMGFEFSDQFWIYIFPYVQPEKEASAETLAKDTKKSKRRRTKTPTEGTRRSKRLRAR